MSAEREVERHEQSLIDTRKLEAIDQILKIAEEHGWNGVDNAKNVVTFISNELDELRNRRRVGTATIPSSPNTGSAILDVVCANLASVERANFTIETKGRRFDFKIVRLATPNR